jgi:Xaa-Pro aminopeptidase
MDISPTMAPPPSGPIRHSSDAERARRIDLLRRLMARDGLDALVVTGRDDIRYRGRTFWVSDVWQLCADSHVVLLPDDGPIFIGGQVFGIEQAELSDWPTDYRINGHPGTEIGLILRERGLEGTTVGIVGLSDASFAAGHFFEFQAECPKATVRDATKLFDDARHGNSEEELTYLRATSTLWKQIFAEVEPLIRPGMTEIELAAQCHRIAREHGARDPMVLMQSTPNDVMGFGTTKTIERGDVVQVWIESAGPSGYWLEYRRNYSFGPPTDEFRRFWELQVEAVAAGMKKLVPGAMAHEFAAEVQRVLQENSPYHLGYGDPLDSHSMYSLHGVGVNAIEGVWVPGNDRVLKDSEVVNIHPPVVFPSRDDARKFAWLGVADNVLVTRHGGVYMTHEPDVRDGFKAL